MKNHFLRLFLLLGVLGLNTVAVHAAEDLGAVKARLAQRLSQLDELKAKGAIGETNRGMVELRDPSPSAGDVTAAENRDREIVYAAIAQQTGSSVETVGRSRAKQIAGGSAAGVWLQRDSGEWYKK